MRSIVLMFLAALTLPLLAFAGAPPLINYQGFLTDDAGIPLDGTYIISFGIHADSVSSIALWEEELYSVLVDDGLFHVVLGSVYPIPDTLFESGDRWLSVYVGYDPEILPRRKITSVPWALRASVADSARVAAGGAGNRHSLDAVDGAPTDVVYVDGDGLVGVGTTTPEELMHIYADADTMVALRIENPNESSASGEGIFFVDEQFWTNARLAVYDYDHPTYPSGMVLANDRSNGHMRFSLGGTERVRIDNIGRVGIGTTAPWYELDVAGTARMQGFRMDTGAAIGYVLTCNGVYGEWQPPAALPDADWTIDGDDMYTDVAGNVGIGTSNPAAHLNVVGSDSLAKVIIGPDVANGGESELFFATDDNGTFGMKMRMDVEDGELQFFGKSGTSVYGPHVTIQQYYPQFKVEGSAGTASFKMNITGDMAVALPNDVISAVEMKNEPGVASAEDGISSVTLTMARSNLLSRTITPPSAGYVLVIGTCQPIGMLDTDQRVRANFGVASNSGSYPGNQDLQWSFEGDNLESFAAPVTAHRIFEVTGSVPYTYYLWGQKLLTSGSIDVYDMQLSVIYFPTAYGTVDPVTAGASAVPDRDAPRKSGLSSAEIADEQAEADRFHAARIERELAEIEARLEELRAMMP